jgi:hypothetical protein
MKIIERRNCFEVVANDGQAGRDRAEREEVPVAQGRHLDFADLCWAKVEMIALLAEVLQFSHQEIPPFFVQPNLKLALRGQVNGYSRCHDVPLRLRAVLSRIQPGFR